MDASATQEAGPRITVHVFDSTGVAYDRTQTGYDAELDVAEDWSPDSWPVLTEPRDGDLLLIWNDREQTVGILVGAWPVVFHGKPGEFHQLDYGQVGWEDLDGGKYGHSVAAAVSMLDMLIHGKFQAHSSRV